MLVQYVGTAVVKNLGLHHPDRHQESWNIDFNGSAMPPTANKKIKNITTTKKTQKKNNDAKTFKNDPKTVENSSKALENRPNITSSKKILVEV